MVNTEPLARISKIVSRLVIAHMVLFAGNAFAHEKLGTFYFVADHLPIVFIFTIVPVVAAFMVEKDKARQGAIVLQGAILAAIFYNIYDHFFIPSIPAFRPIPLIWNILYEGSFGALLIIEVFVMWHGIKLYRRMHSDKTPKDSNAL
jgi:hypothetical protein